MGSVAGLLPGYLSIAVASLALTALNQAWGRFLTGLSVGILLYLFFDVMHEAMELTGVHDILSWPILLGSLFVNFSGWRPSKSGGGKRTRPIPLRSFFLL